MIAPHRLKAFIVRHVYEIASSIDRKVDIFFWPVIDLLTFGLLTVYINQLGTATGFAGALIAGLIFWTLIYGVTRDIAFSLLEDAWSRNLFNLYSSPLKVGEVIVGSLILSIIKACITVTIVVSIAFGLFHFNLFAHGMIVFFYLFNIFVFGWWYGFVATFLILRFGTKIQTVAWSLVALIYPISGIFYPLSVLPPALQLLAKAVPVSYIFEDLRAMIISNEGPDAAGLLAVTLLNLAYLSIGIWLYVRGFRHAKRRGWFVHPT